MVSQWVTKFSERIIGESEKSKRASGAVYAEGLEKDVQTTTKGWELSGRQKMVLRTLCAWTVYQLVVCIFYLPNKDDWALNETSGFIDALYFGSVTLSTVGYGDILPTTDHTRLITAFLILFALSFLMYLLGEVTNLVLCEITAANDKALEIMGNMDSDGDGIPDKEENSVMRCIFSKRFQKASRGATIILINLAMGTTVMLIWEDVDFVEALYTSMVTITTVGYGDFSFTRAGTRLFAAVWLLIAPVLTSYGLTSIVEAVFNTDGNGEKLRKHIMESALDQKSLEEMDKDGDGKFSNEEFATYIVKQLVEADLAQEEANDYLKELIENLKKVDREHLC